MAPTTITSVFITVYYNGYVEKNPAQGLLFNCQNNTLVKLKSNFKLNDVRAAIQQIISPDHSKTVAGLTYRYPITAFGGQQFYGGIEITSENELQLLMEHYKENRQFGMFTPEVYADLVDAPENFTQVTHDHSLPSSSQYNIGFSQPDQTPYTSRVQPFNTQFYPSSSQPDMHYTPTTPHFHMDAPSSSNTPIHINTANPTPTETNTQPFRMQFGVYNDDVGDYSEDEDEIINREIPDEPNQATPNLTPNIGVTFYEPVPHFQNIGHNQEPYDEFAHAMDRDDHFTNEDEDDLKVGMTFPSKQMAQQFIQTYSLKHSVAYENEESKPSVWAVVCVHETCLWRCVVRLGKKTGYWKITQLTHPHTCTTTTISQDHKQLTSSFMSNHILQLVRQDPTISVPVLIAHIKERFTYQSSYRKAWIAKQKAIQTIYGNWELSYNEVTKWLSAFMRYIPGTVCDFQCKPFYENGQQVEGKGVFKRIFWSFGPCIEGFKYCKPVVSIDGTWLYGRYKGCLLLAIAQDGRNQCFPIAYAVVEGETKEAWYFFLSRLKQAVTPQDGLCLISDRHESIKSAVTQLDANWKHVFCVRHIAQNFMRRFKNTEGRKALINMAYSMTEISADYYKNIMWEVAGDEAVEWVDAIEKEQLFQHKDKGLRWGHMTTNLSECINNVLKGVRNLPIRSLIEATYFRMNQVFVNRGTQAEAMVNAGNMYSDKVMEKITRNINVSKSHNVAIHDRSRQLFRVEEIARPRSGRPASYFIVNFREQTCDCGEFQALHYPCSHVIAACSKCNYDHMGHVHDTYKMENVLNAYKVGFPPLPDPTSWPPFNVIELQHDPEKRRDKKGRPQSTRIHTEMDQRESGRRPKRCGLCRAEGHNKNNCPNRT